MDITEKVLQLTNEHYWEVKAQALIFATNILTSFRSMSHLLSQKEDVKGIQKSMSGKPGSSSGQNGQDRNTVKKNLNQAVEIINKCFNTLAPKSVQKLGLFELQPLLNDYKILYPAFIEVLLQIDPEIKQIILSEEPIRGINTSFNSFLAGEDIYFSLGNVSFNYKLRSDLGNFDKIILANTLIDMVIQSQLESLELEHMQLLSVCCGDSTDFLNIQQNDAWFKVFQKLKDYLLVSICDPDLCEQALNILHNFLTVDQLKFQIYEVLLKY